MEISFVKTNPTKNMTILVTSPVPKSEYLAVAEGLMAYDSVYAEQVGYIETPKNPKADGALSMMAGEFCGNATLSLGAWLMEEAQIPVGTTKTYQLEVSGANALVSCTLTKGAEDYFGWVDMPLPKEIKEETFRLDGKAFVLPVVVFDGITHIIVNKSLWWEHPKETAELAAKQWAAVLPQAFGILLWEESRKEMTPLVAVQGSSLVWEGGCGSGTSALGAYLAEREGKDISFYCQEPGGSMGVEVKLEGRQIVSLKVGGHVAMVAKGVAYLP